MPGPDWFFPDGSTEPIQGKAGQAVWADSTEHLPENLSDDPLELSWSR